MCVQPLPLYWSTDLYRLQLNSTKFEFRKQKFYKILKNWTVIRYTISIKFHYKWNPLNTYDDGSTDHEPIFTRSYKVMGWILGKVPAVARWLISHIVLLFVSLSHTLSPYVIFSLSPMHFFTIPLWGGHHHHRQPLPCRPCTHTKTSTTQERWRTYQGYGCPGQQWLSSGGGCVRLGAVPAVLHRCPWWRNAERGRFPVRGETEGSWGGQKPGHGD